MELFRKEKRPPQILRLRACVDVFREQMTQLQVSGETSLVAETLAKRMGTLIEAHQILCIDSAPKMEALRNEVIAAHSKPKKGGEEGEGLDSEMCQEQEQE
jgi:hypothetical protein